MEQSGYKDVSYVRDLVHLSFLPARIMVLNYSPRIINLRLENGQTMFSGSPEDIAEQTARSFAPSIGANYWSETESIKNLRIQFREIDVTLASPRLTYDLGCLAFLADDTDDAHRCFDALAAWRSTYRPPDDLSEGVLQMLERLGDGLDQFRRRPGDFGAYLLKEVRTNSAALGFIVAG